MLIADPEIGTLAEVFCPESGPRILKWVNREKGLLGCLLHYVMRFGFIGTLGGTLWKTLGGTLWNTAHCYSIQGKRWLRLSSVQLPVFSWHWPSIGPRTVASACLDCIDHSLFPIALEMTEHRNSTYLMHGPVFLDYVELKALQKHGASQASATSSFTVVRALLRCGNLLPMEDRKKSDMTSVDGLHHYLYFFLKEVDKRDFKFSTI